MKNKFILIIIIFLIFVTFIILTICIPGNNNSNDASNWNYDKSEYTKDQYKLDELPISHKSANEVRQFFEDSDVNHDEILKDKEINTFDYKIKHSQYTFNGPYGYN